MGFKKKRKADGLKVKYLSINIKYIKLNTAADTSLTTTTTTILARLRTRGRGQRSTLTHSSAPVLHVFFLNKGRVCALC